MISIILLVLGCFVDVIHARPKVEGPCKLPLIPRNGLLAVYGDLLIPMCRRGLYPPSAWSPFYRCENGRWTGLITTSDISDCTETSPSGDMTETFELYYHFDGFCEEAITIKQAKLHYALLGLCPIQPSCKIDDVKVYCRRSGREEFIFKLSQSLN